MLGAIVGDIVGSVYEWNNIKTKEFPLQVLLWRLLWGLWNADQ